MSARTNGEVFVDVGMSLDGLIAGPNGPALEIMTVRPSSQVTHLSYRVLR